MKCRIKGSKRLKLIQTFIKVTVHLVMFILFLRFYFIEQFIQFLKNESAFFEIEPKEIQMEAPAIVLCHNYINAQLLEEKYNLNYISDISTIHGYEKIPEIPGRTKFDLYQEISNFTDFFLIRANDLGGTPITLLFEGTNRIAH